MAHCPPVSIQTNLHSTIHTSGTTSQSDTAVSARCKIDNWTSLSELHISKHLQLYNSRDMHRTPASCEWVQSAVLLS